MAFLREGMKDRGIKRLSHLKYILKMGNIKIQNYDMHTEIC